MILEIKKMKMELARVQANKLEMEFIIAQRTDEIKRLEDAIKIQEDKEKEILNKLKEIGG